MRTGDNHVLPEFNRLLLFSCVLRPFDGVLHAVFCTSPAAAAINDDYNQMIICYYSTRVIACTVFRSVSSSVWRRLPAKHRQARGVLGWSGRGYLLVQEMGPSSWWFRISIHKMVTGLTHHIHIQDMWLSHWPLCAYVANCMPLVRPLPLYPQSKRRKLWITWYKIVSKFASYNWSSGYRCLSVCRI